MNRWHKMLAMIVAAAPLIFAIPAFATPYTFTSTGVFTNCTGSGCTGNNTNSLAWGSGSPMSSLTASTLSNQTGNTPAVADQIGQLIWVNNKTDGTEFNGAIFTLNLNFSAPPPGASGSQVFSLQIDNTPNDLLCNIISVCGSSNADTINGLTIANPGTLAIDNLILSNFTFVASGSNTSFSNGVWTNQETKTATLKIFANIANAPPAPPAVPEPATLALLGAGVVGLGLARRRRRT